MLAQTWPPLQEGTSEYVEYEHGMEWVAAFTPAHADPLLRWQERVIRIKIYSEENFRI